MSQADFAASVDDIQENIHFYETGKAKFIPYEFMNKLHKKHKCNLNWLVSGSGEMKINGIDLHIRLMNVEKQVGFLLNGKK